jgi:predicted AlkP superfamily phosphohydrolase/phosphomutase
VAALSALGLSPARAAGVLEAAGLLGVARRFAPEGVVSAAGVSERVDFAESTAYMRLPVELGVRLNVAGREPEGVVPPDEYESVRADLIDLLSGVTTPDGDPMFERVAPREAVFDGPRVEDAVDVVTVPAGFENFPAAQLRGDVFGAPGEPWNHKLHGVVGVNGPDVPERETSDAHLLDVAPTVLSLLGVPLSDRMEGSPLVGDRPPTRAYDRPDREQTDPPGEGVEAHLSNLGYLD